jgi:hypothetical protein
MVPVMAKPVIPVEPAAPNLVALLPKTVTVTAAEAAYYKEACDAWNDIDYTKEIMAIEYPDLSRGASCDWAVKGYTVQAGLTFEQMWNLSADYAEQMRNYAKTLKKQIDSLYEQNQKTQEAMQQVNTERTKAAEKSSWKFWE